MGPLIENCPFDVINEIINHLEPDAIRSLRLSCKTLAIKSSSSYGVKALFRSKHIELTEQALRACAVATQAEGLCCHVKEVTLSGIAGGDDDAPRRTRQGGVQLWRKNKEFLLSQSFIALKRNGPTGRLASLSLKVAIPPHLKARIEPANPRGEYDWRPLSEAAVDAFHITFRALATSQLRIDSLNMFNGPGQQRRSLPCNALSKVDWDSEGLVESLSSMRSLSISLSNRVYKLDEDEKGHVRTDNGTTRGSRNHYDENDVSIAQEERNFTGLASLFQLSKNLESFELHYFSHRGELQGLLYSRDWCHERLLQRLVALNSLPNLTRSTLRGIYATETDLLAFIKRTRVSELSLESVTLSLGTFRSIFDYCTSSATSITKLNFDVLYEMGERPSHMVLFLGAGPSRLVYGETGLGGESLERGRDDINQPISYYTLRSRLIGSPTASRWATFRIREYGST